MTLKHWLAASALLPGLCLTALPALSQQQTGDSVADAARKTREQQKTAQKPKKVFTNDDFKSATPSPSASSSSTDKGSTSQATDNTQASSKTGTTDDAEKAWRQRFADQRAKIAQAQQELDVLQREQSKAQVQYYNDPTKAMNEQYSRKDINDKQDKIDQKKKQIADLQQQLSNMEDELRKSGGDPGWARE
ncbi:MAG TPA: hypothetical protein VJN93_10435 [Candidatus Acidoferrum sp.]|nr:hypothetical protein [Candidatus Acidoferrum sp.]